MSQDGLQQFRDAVADDDLAGALAALDAAERDIDAAEDRDLAFRALARGVRARTDDDDAESLAREYEQAAQQADTERLQFGYNLLALTEGETAPSSMLGAVDSLIAAQEQAASLGADLREVDAAGAVPPQLAMVGPDSVDVRVGRELSLAFTVENVGTSALAGLAVDLEVEDGLDVGADPASVDLAAGEAQAVTVAGTASSAGEYDVRVSVGADSVAETELVPVVVATRVDYLQRAREQIQALIEDAEAAEDDGEKGGKGNRGLANQYRTADNRLVKIVRKAKDGSAASHQLDNETRSVMELLGAAINHAEAEAGNSLPERDAALLGHDTGEAIETLARSLDPSGDGNGTGNG